MIWYFCPLGPGGPTAFMPCPLPLVTPGTWRRTLLGAHPDGNPTTTENVIDVAVVPDVGEAWGEPMVWAGVQGAAATAWMAPESGSHAGTPTQLAPTTIVAITNRRADHVRARTCLCIVSEPTESSNWTVGRGRVSVCGAIGGGDWYFRLAHRRPSSA